MANGTTVTDQVRVALETERQFEFYFIGLIFTVVALAVNFFTPYKIAIFNVLALISFACLFVSGICALFALNYLAKRHWLIADQRGWRDGLAAIQQARTSGLTQVTRDGQNEPVADTIAYFESNIGPTETRSIILRRRVDLLREVRLWTFVTGLFILLLVKALSALYI